MRTGTRVGLIVVGGLALLALKLTMFIGLIYLTVKVARWAWGA